ncbi:MAG: MBL fold metallo-hydrolase [Anaerovorax sp.]
MKTFKQERFNFGDHMTRVTAGPGGEAILLWGSEKTALMDCGMAFCGLELVEHVKEALMEMGSGRTLDYILLSHTHYDHIGGMTYLKEAWPNALVLGSSYAKYVLTRPGALQVIRGLSVHAARTFNPNIESWELDWAWKPVEIQYPDEEMKIEGILKDGDSIDLGDRMIRVIETKGHTNCSLSFFLEESCTLLASETLGCYINSGNVVAPILKSYKETVRSIEKCRKITLKQLISPHYGKIPTEEINGYWDKARNACQLCKNVVLEAYEAGGSSKDILDVYTEKFWVGYEKNQQPKEAFLINAKQIVSVILKEFVI